LDLLAELTGVMSGGVTQDLWILSIGIDNNPWDRHAVHGTNNQTSNDKSQSNFSYRTTSLFACCDLQREVWGAQPMGSYQPTVIMFPC